jgi:DNA-binding CsgD family transcriptional regulator
LKNDAKSQGVSLAESLAALSIATDLAKGQRKQSAMGAALLASRMARILGLSEAAQADTYYAALLRLLGCTSISVEAAQISMGDDQNGFYTFSLADWADPEHLRDVAAKYFLPAVNARDRAQQIDFGVEHLAAFNGSPMLYCGQAVFLASRLPVPERAVDLLNHIEARWDGKLGDVPGEGTPVEARILLLATHATLYYWIGGPSAAVDFASARSGRQFDPTLSALLNTEQQALFAGFDESSLLPTLLDEEPGNPRKVGRAALESLALTIGQFADQKTGWCAGHSTRVMRLAADAANVGNLGEAARERLRRAALTHDIGRVAIPNSLLERADQLSGVERLEYRQHTFHTEYLLSLVPTFDDIAHLASSAHERADGSGYHRGSRTHDASEAVLAAANRYVELLEDRPWRDAFETNDAANKLLEGAAEGRFIREAVSSVLEAAGHGQRRAERAYPAGLTRREVEVLRCIVQGRTTGAIGARLGISPKTADHHIQSIYEKTGARGRAASAFFALRNEIFAE